MSQKMSKTKYRGLQERVQIQALQNFTRKIPLPPVLTVSESIYSRASNSNRLKYRSGLSSNSAKFIFSGLSPIQVFCRLILLIKIKNTLNCRVQVPRNKNLKIQIRLGFKNLKQSIRLMFWYTATGQAHFFSKILIVSYLAL